MKGVGPGNQKPKIVLNKKLRNFLVCGFVLIPLKFENFITKQAPKQFFPRSSPRPALILFSQLFRLPALIRSPPVQGATKPEKL